MDKVALEALGLCQSDGLMLGEIGEGFLETPQEWGVGELRIVVGHPQKFDHLVLSG